MITRNGTSIQVTVYLIVPAAGDVLWEKVTMFRLSFPGFPRVSGWPLHGTTCWGKRAGQRDPLTQMLSVSLPRCPSLFPESARWLLATQQLEKGKRILRTVAEGNGVLLEDDFFTREHLFAGEAKGMMLDFLVTPEQAVGKCIALLWPFGKSDCVLQKRHIFHQRSSVTSL